MSQRISISIVNYANTLPFKWALKNSALLQKIDLQEDIPSICAQKLKLEQVDLALVPVALIPELETYMIQSRYCIGANQKVNSVNLYSQVPLSEISTIVLDYQSRTSIALAQILCREFWKIRPNFEDARPGFENKIQGDKAAVVIGDRTFALNGRFKFEYDLAQEWHKFTGLPFVFAAWLSTKPLPSEFMEEFDRVLEHGISNITTAVKEMGDFRSISEYKLIKYLKEDISYPLDSEKMKGLERFLAYLK